MTVTEAESARIASPCIKLCVLDAQGAACLGCGRKLADILNWAIMSEAERRTIMAKLKPLPALPSGSANQR